ncbi:N-acetylmuramoyl-L-alanine amidase [Cardinium endosymbiont of Tipula unca]|uniref:N-acetylmuramoyl-L-alanine amidase n=1 Tax=Cardinium endosymbiont of Tipula unca TaxID=3066216 RepID=UPI0030CBD4F4
MLFCSIKGANRGYIQVLLATSRNRIYFRRRSNNRVSAHYVISEKEDHIASGKLLQIVPDEMRAWHAGVSGWRTDKNLNPVSLGIEHVNSRS